MKEVRQRMSVQRSREAQSNGGDIGKTITKQFKFLRDFSLINPVNIILAIEQELEEEDE